MGSCTTQFRGVIVNLHVCIYMVFAYLPASHNYAHCQNEYDTKEHPKEDIQYFGLARRTRRVCCLDNIKVESTDARDLLAAQRTAQIPAELLNDGQQNVLG